LVLRKNGNPIFLLEAKLAVPNTVEDYITFTTIDKDRIPTSINSRDPQWIRVDFREPIEVSTRQKYQLFVQGRSSHPTNNYSIGAGFNSYQFGDFTRNPSAGGEVLLFNDLLLKIHYQLSPKQLR
ncbi:MAG: hypothetical protein AAB972_05030, partial [Patescibacteria group bacterium]